MSDDYKAAFRAAQAQRGLAAKPTKEQLKALKARKAAPPPAAAAQRLQQPAATAVAAPATKSTAGLPADFFDAKGSKAATPQQQPAATSQSKQQPQQLAGSKRPAPAAGSTSSSKPAVGSDAVADAAVPKGFFDDKAEDKKARGIKEPDKKDKEAAFAEFSAAIDTQLKQQAADEDEEAEDAAQERDEREAFEQRLRIQRAAELKALKSNPAAVVNVQIDAAIAAAVPSAGKKRRVVDVLQDVLGASEEGSEEAESEEDALLDWRAKTV